MNVKSIKNLLWINVDRYPCEHCQQQITAPNMLRHVRSCAKNPDNWRECAVCHESSKFDGVTCSYACANRHFRTGTDHPSFRSDSSQAHRTICFETHGKRCLICGEFKMVEAHHINEDDTDNRPENLVPLCPTHHQYVHSRYRDEVQPKIDDFISSYKQGVSQQQTAEPGTRKQQGQHLSP